MRRSRRLALTIALIVLAWSAYWLRDAPEDAVVPRSVGALSGAGASPVTSTHLEPDRNARATRGHAGMAREGRAVHMEARGRAAGIANRPVNRQAFAESTSTVAAVPVADDRESSEADPARDGIDDLPGVYHPGEQERVVLDTLEIPVDTVSTRITGMDYGAPRKLTLWRVDQDRAARLAGTNSRPGGHFDFGQILVPWSGLRLVATPVGEEPEAWQRDQAAALHPQRFDRQPTSPSDP